MSLPRVALTAVALLFFLAPFAAASQQKAPVVLFDQGHEQRFVIEKSGGYHLSKLAEVFKRKGYTVRSTTEPLTPASLAEVDVLVSSGAFAPLSPEELETVVNFVRGGGSVSVMLHIAPTYSGFLRAFGIMAANGVIHETKNVIGTNSLNFRLSVLRDHPLFEGINEFNAYGVWALLDLDKNTSSVGITSKQAWIDMDRDKVRNPSSEPLHAYAVVVAGGLGEGKIAAFGDDAIFQDEFIDGNNMKLAENLAGWLAP